MSSKEAVLQRLKASCGTYLSGEKLAADLGLSRNSVWKAINALRKSGYEIDAVTNRGYALLEADVLSQDGVAQYLLPSIDRRLISVVPTIASTNQRAKELAINGAPGGTVLIAGEQTHGAAHHAESFFSPPGGLYLSVILPPDYLAAMPPRTLTEFAAWAVCDVIRTVGGRMVQLHGINDLYLDGKKCGGILTESVTDFESGEYQWIVVGIGILAAVRRDAFPSALRTSLTSLYPDSAPDAASRNEMAAAILNHLLQPPLLDADEIHRRYESFHE